MSSSTGTYGGKRKGAGRLPLRSRDRKVKFSITLDPDVVALLDRHAQGNRSAAIEAALRQVYGIQEQPPEKEPLGIRVRDLSLREGRVGDGRITWVILDYPRGGGPALEYYCETDEHGNGLWVNGVQWEKPAAWSLAGLSDSGVYKKIRFYFENAGSLVEQAQRAKEAEEAKTAKGFPKQRSPK